jgi:hypothetical protein
MTNDERIPKARMCEAGSGATRYIGLGASSFPRHSDFDIRHFPFTPLLT